MSETNPTFNIQLTLDQVNEILGLLGTHPFNTVANLIVLLRTQAQTQAQERQQAAQVQGKVNGESRVGA